MGHTSGELDATDAFFYSAAGIGECIGSVARSNKFCINSAGAHFPEPLELGERLRLILVWIACVCVWLGPVIYELKFGKNIGFLFERHAVANTHAAGRLAALEALWIGWQQVLGVELVWNSGALLFLLLLFGLGWVGLAAALRPGEQSNLIAIGFFFILSTFFYLLVLAGLKPPLHNFYIHGWLTFALLIFGIMLAGVERLVFISQARWLSVLSLVTLGLLLFHFAGSAWRATIGSATSPFVPYSSLAQAQALTELLAADRAGQIAMIRIYGAERHRESALYYLFSDSHAHLVQYHSSFARCLVCTRARTPG